MANRNQQKILTAKVCAIVLAFFACALSADAQQFANSWIDYSQPYYRVGIVQTGVYRITRAQLANAGVPIDDHQPQNLQIFQNGKEIPCYVAGESAGLIDYIEFYAESNSGWFDAELFDNAENQANPYYSLINDTAAVFITWNNKFSNKRLKQLQSVEVASAKLRDYCYRVSQLNYVATYLNGDGQCGYGEAEGWFDNTALALGATVSKRPTMNSLYQSETLMVESEMSLGTYSTQKHHLQITGLGFNVDTVFSGLKTIKCCATAPSKGINTTFSVSSINDQEAATDYSRMAYLRVKYPSTFSFENSNSQAFILPACDTVSHLKISGVSNATLLYDLSRGLRIEVNGGSQVQVPATDTAVNLLVVNNAGLLAPAYITKTSFTNHKVSGKKVIVLSHKQLQAQAKNYANYRDAYYVDIQELYDQFAYGIQKHPLAIKKFVQYALNQWSTKPEYLFIIGKGIASNSTRNNATLYNNCLVPAVGNPPSDALLTIGLDPNFPQSPALATGRLAATTNKQVADYLDKVREFEQNEPAEWMKQVIHFGGGKTVVEQTIFKLYLNLYKEIISDSLFGAQVSSFYKQTSDPIATSRTDSVTRMINRGVSLMTFFGHGSSTYGFDQDIDSPTAYSNKGRYPFILSNSCYTGNIFITSNNSTSEVWIMTPNCGAIGFLASSGEGVPTYLNGFSTEFYTQLANKSYGEPIGNVIRHAINALESSGGSVNVFNTAREMLLHGDPCVVLNSPKKSDLQASVTDFNFQPSVLSTAVDTIVVDYQLRNIGRSVTSDFVVELKRTFANGEVQTYQTVVNQLNYTQNIRFYVATNSLKGAGVNTFSIKLDAMNQVEELDESNNTASVSVYVSPSSVSLIDPYNYALLPAKPDVLRVSTPTIGQKVKLQLQVDTTEQMNGNLLINSNINADGGLVNVDAEKFNLDEGVPYFWRAKEQDYDFETINSFVYRNGMQGWEQSAFEQIDDNDFQFISIDTANQRFEFTENARTLRCHNVGAPNSSNYISVGYTLEGIGATSSCGAVAALLVVVIDSATLDVWRSSRANYGQYNYPNCTGNTENYYIFRINDGVRDQSLASLVDFIENDVPSGNYILIYDFINGYYTQWGEEIYQAFESWGASELRAMPDRTPYIFFTQKGHPEKAQEVVGEAYNSEIDFYVTLKGSSNYGVITSPIIGPAKSWESIQWGSKSVEAENSYDDAYLTIYGVKNETETLLFNQEYSNNIDLSQISVADYPQLKMQFVTSDAVNHTPSQLDFWRVQYEPYTDLSVNLLRAWSFANDTLWQGQRAKVEMAFENVGQSDADSVLVHYWVQTADNQTIEVGYHKLKPLKKGEWIADTVSFSTANMRGVNFFWAELNPKPIGASAYDQPEQTHFNNFLQNVFYVTTDSGNPLLDVTFDGQHIADGQMVSAQTAITISVTDDYNYLPFDNTSFISVYLTMPNGEETRLNLDAENVEFTLTEGRLQVVYHANFETDGAYLLRVRAHDASGNESGINDYVISFNVTTVNRISNFACYPNPFSQSARFAFEINGSQLPDELKVEILNSYGFVVRTIDVKQLGGINFGNNISAPWDGRDNYGNLLPSGVYMFRVIAKVNGVELPRKASPADRNLNNGVGRLIIVR
ncbi:MAG: C25 family cysteine peptidase [Salinivirgaceae bacterium]|nr:C25 family cysteine peptidase [Salinivirgaceae bacterium]